MKLELLSTNLVKIIEGCVRNDSVAKLLYYNINDPLSQPSINPSTIAPFGASERVIPYPFDINYKEEQRSQLHIYYPDLQFVNGANVEEVVVFFDIVVHRKLWLFTQNGQKLIRPYEIASNIASQFDGSLPNTKTTIGKLDFLGMNHMPVNEEFDCIRIQATMTTF